MVRRFLNNLGTIVLSLVLAILVWVTAVREQNPPHEADYDRNIPIKVIPPVSGLVTTDDLPKVVRLRLLAPESSWSTLSPSKFKALIDLSKLPEGFSDVPVQVNISDPEITVIEKMPNEVSVTLQPEQTVNLPVKVEVTDEPPLGYWSRPSTVTPAQVTIIGPASLVDQIDRVISEVSIRGSKETIDHPNPVVIYDREGQIIDGLKVEPPKVQIILPIEQRFGYKDVSVRVVVQGQPAPGYWVSNISVTPPQLTIVGNAHALSLISGFIETTPIEVSQTTKDIIQTVPLNLPNGVSVVLPKGENSGAGGVKVTISIAAIESGQTVERPITQQGIDPNYVWTVSPQWADVILSGPIPRLQGLKPGEVKVIVDLFGLKPGTHKVHPAVFTPDGLRVEAILPDTVEITISPNPTLTPMPTLTPTVTVTDVTGEGTVTPIMTTTPTVTVTIPTVTVIPGATVTP